jgi:hypothetical protein
MPGFPSYCTGSLLIIASSITSCCCPRIGRHDFSHAYPSSPPNQVRLRYGPSTSYHFLQTPPLASDALVSWILFPVDGVRSLSSSDWVCQLRWANKKRPPRRSGLFYERSTSSCRLATETNHVAGVANSQLLHLLGRRIDRSRFRSRRRLNSRSRLDHGSRRAHDRSGTATNRSSTTASGFCTARITSAGICTARVADGSTAADRFSRTAALLVSEQAA